MPKVNPFLFIRVSPALAVFNRSRRNNIKNNNRDPSAALIGSLTDYKNKQINKCEIIARGNIRKKI